MPQDSKKSIALPYADGQNLYEINEQDEHIKKYQSEVLNIANKHGKGNDDEIVGMVSQVIKDYRATVDDPTIEGWKEFHHKLKGIKGIDVGIEKNWAKFQEMKTAINSITKETMRYWLENLVYNKTFAGLQAQDMVLKDIAKRLSEETKEDYTYKNGNSDDERAQIDGYIIRPDGKMCGLQVKSNTYKSHNNVEKNAPVPYVYYNLDKAGLGYTFDTADLEFVDESQYEELKKAAKERESIKQSKIAEKKRKEEETQKRRIEREKKKAAQEMARIEKEKKKAERIARKEAIEKVLTKKP